MRISTLKALPKVADAVIKRDAQLEAFTQDFIAKKRAKAVTADTPLYIIPVVFHIIHDYTECNISDAQVNDCIRVTNEIFRKQRADTASVVEVFKPLHADCEIEFRLAQKDPNGNCTSGINRIASTYTFAGQHIVKSLIQWDPSKYLNVYVVKNAAGLAGHAVWPSDADTIPEWDGIVIGHDYVGSIGTASPTTSIVLAHECGHYLNLQHIWGGNNVPNFYYYPCADPNKDCNIDDLVDDTPPTIGWQSCNLSGASCGNTVDMVQNSMDYSYCNKIFTYGQRDRMQACLNSPIAHRNNLWQPANLIATGVADSATLCKADFGANKVLICPSASPQITFSNLSYNTVADSVLWTFEGGSPATSTAASPVVAYSSPGKYNTTLKVFSGNNTAEITKTDFVSVLTSSGNPYPFIESFETGNADGWTENSFDTLNHWQVTNTAAYSGSKSIMLNICDMPQETKDELYSPIIDLTGATQMKISFKYAFSGKDSIIYDHLQVWIFKNCNANESKRLELTGTTFRTAPPQTTPFVPASVAEWKQGVVNIPPTYFDSDFRFKFVYSSSQGNNLYLDDINVDISAGIESPANLEFSLFPNPASNRIDVGFSLAFPSTIAFSVVDILGQTVLDMGKHHFLTTESHYSIPVGELNNGFYFLKMEVDGRTAVKSFVVQGN